MQRAEAYVEGRLARDGYRAACGHVGECGCVYGGPCCLKCVLSGCVLDVGVQAMLREKRDVEMVRLFREGVTRGDLAARFGVSEQTVGADGAGGVSWPGSVR